LPGFLIYPFVNKWSEKTGFPAFSTRFEIALKSARCRKLLGFMITLSFFEKIKPILPQLI
jgi:hypothetical protein